MTRLCKKNAPPKWTGHVGAPSRPLSILRMMVSVASFVSMFALCPSLTVAAPLVCSGTHVVTEDFSTTAKKYVASAAGWDGVAGVLTLPSVSNAFSATDELMEHRVFAATSAGDPDGDGDDDLVVLIKSPDDFSADAHLQYLTNLGFISGVHQGWDFDGNTIRGGNYGSPGWNLRVITGSAQSMTGALLLSGDIDGDGDMDILLLNNTDPSHDGALAAASGAWVFEADTSTPGTPVYTAFDVTSDLSHAPDPTAPSGDTRFNWHWPAATSAQLYDWDAMGRAGLTVFDTRGTSGSAAYGQVFRFDAGDRVASGAISMTAGVFNTDSPCSTVHDPDPELGLVGLATPVAGASEATAGCVSAAAVSHGGTLLLVADFDADGDEDLITGSMSETDLKFWAGNTVNTCAAFGNENPRYAAPETIAFSEGGAAYGVTGDFTGDGRIDFIIGRDAQGCGGAGGTGWLFVNQASGVPFVKHTVPVINRGNDLDWMVTLDVDGDGTKDVMAGQAVLDSPYDMLLMGATPLYADEAEALSLVMDTLDNDTFGIVSLEVTTLNPLRSTYPGNTTVELWVSNNAGDDWATLSDGVIDSGDTHTFTTYGSDFIYTVVLRGDVDALSAANSIYYPASPTTPSVTDLSFTLHTVPQYSYSRSGATGGTGLEAGKLYVPSFRYPSFVGRMYAYEPTTFSSGALTRLDDGSLAVDWEAGAVSTTSPGASGRNLLAGYADTGTATVKTVAISSAETGSPTGTPSLLTMMNMGSAASANTVISFIRNGMSDTDSGLPKFMDWGHSTPQHVQQPVGNDTFFGSDYVTYKSDNASRTGMVYIGGNSGFLHGIRASDGVEIFALAPENLLGKLRTQRDMVESSIVYGHDEFVDGALRVFDVYDAEDSAWKTILISGQALGEGSDGNNYYFAVDVTDPTAGTYPQPLWQFTDDVVSGGGSCDRSSGDDCAPSCAPVCGTPAVCTSSTCVSTESDSLFIPNSSNEIVIDAESSNFTAGITHVWGLVTGDATYTGFDGPSFMNAGAESATECTTSNLLTCGASLTYRVRIDRQGSYRIRFRYYAESVNESAIIWRLDDGAATLETTTSLGTPPKSWGIHGTAAIPLDAGVHTVTVYMGDDDMRLDRIYVSEVDPVDDLATHSCEEICTKPTCTYVCTETCIDPDTQAWPTCGDSTNEKCCENGDADFCHPLGDDCGDADTASGETWSPPAVGKFRVDDKDVWLAIFASGYNNRDFVNVGRSIYAVNALTGALVGKFDLDDLPASGTNPSTIDNTVPGGVRLVDLDSSSDPGYGYVDRVYVGDLEGRLWRIDTSSNATLFGGLIAQGTGSNAHWAGCVVFDARDDGGSGRWAPIITTPAAAVLPGANRPNLYFGTGGDDRAPSTSMYQFFSVRDDSAPGVCPATPKTESDLDYDSLEWVVGDGKDNTRSQAALSPATNEGSAGERFWSDPVVFANSIILFSSLPGSIETVNPCDTAAGVSRVYGYALRNNVIVAGTRYSVGSSIFGASAFLLSQTKSRQAAIIMGYKDEQVTTSTPPEPAAGEVVNAVIPGFSADDKAPIEGVEIGTIAEASNPLQTIRWREVPL